MKTFRSGRCLSTKLIRSDLPEIIGPLTLRMHPIVWRFLRNHYLLVFLYDTHSNKHNWKERKKVKYLQKFTKVGSIPSSYKFRHIWPMVNNKKNVMEDKGWPIIHLHIVFERFHLSTIIQTIDPSHEICKLHIACAH